MVPDRHAALTRHFGGKKAKTRRWRREEFHAKVVDVCSGYARTICQALCIYKEDCEAMLWITMTRGSECTPPGTGDP